MKSILQTIESVNIRIRHFNVMTDRPGVLDTESACEDGWDDKTLSEFYFRDTSIVKVSLLRASRYVSGHYGITLGKESIWLRRIAVKPGLRRQGIGTALLQDAAGVAKRKRIPLLIPVREKDLAMQLWLKHRGARCIRIATDYDPPHATYWFLYCY